MTDAVTRAWVRDASDELAVRNGCRFNPERGALAVFWIERLCRLYEGEQAGEPMRLRGCAECDYGLPDLTAAAWDGDAIAVMLERARRHCDCHAAGHALDWQFEVTMRLFGWERWSERWQRRVRRFRQAGIWVPKKNKKSPTLAAWGLYLECGDGEPGQKVYFGAKDGNQSREIAGRHAAEMVAASPELSDECTINKVLCQVTHEPTRSILKPISSGDSRAAKAKEGLNGSVLIDETHVVDREFMNRVSRAGISRSEPLLIEVSTAGSDPEGYGRERYDYGKAVASGAEENDSFLFVAHEAPQDLADADLAADPVKYGKLANPAWGHTVDPAEFLADYQQSRRSVSALADFKMYRLDVWQQSSNPWLDMGDWAACRRDYQPADLDGLPCYGGLDLAKTRDTTALALLFPDGQLREVDGELRPTYRQWVHFWLPEATAERLQKDVRYREWARSGWVTLTPGDTTDYQFVRAEIKRAFARHRVLRLAFDGTYAAQLVQRLTDEDGLPLESFVEYRQRLMDFAAPTAAYERAVIDRRLYHPGNPCLTWQAGNVRVKSDANQNMRPVKQKHGDTRTIDGMVAGIMALGLALLDKGPSVYETRGVLGLDGDDAPPAAAPAHAAPAGGVSDLWADDPEDD